jgi:hypothetical protein
VDPETRVVCLKCGGSDLVKSYDKYTASNGLEYIGAIRYTCLECSVGGHKVSTVYNLRRKNEEVVP